MELKQICVHKIFKFFIGLNRTFYGIETAIFVDEAANKIRLNRTFYGIETSLQKFSSLNLQSLNRTFYGIETLLSRPQRRKQRVLIVPFMELKQKWL